MFLITGLDNLREIKSEMTLVDVTSTVLHLLGIDWRRFDFDGKCILKEI